MTDEELINAYVVQELSTVKVAKLARLHPRTVQRRLGKLGVPRRGVPPGLQRYNDLRVVCAATLRVPNSDEAFLAALYAAHPQGYLGPWLDKKRSLAA
jgi:hypothetical protein